MKIAQSDAPVKVYRPARHIRFFLCYGFALVGGIVMLLPGIGTLYKWLNDVPQDIRLDPFVETALFVGGLLCLCVALPPLVRYCRVFTAVYRDRVVISTGLRTRIVPLAEVLRAMRSPRSDGRDPIWLETTDVGYEDLAVQFVDDAEQDEFMALVNGLVAERRTP
jgi:hypothetical protein